MNIQERPEIIQRVNWGIDFMSQFFQEIIFEDKCDKVRAILPQDEYRLMRAIEMCGLNAFALHYFGRYLSKETRARLTDKAVLHVSGMLRYDKFIKDIRDALDAAGIEFIAFKGIDTAFRCYPVPGLRRMSDIDLLFHKEDLPRAEEVLGSIGWKQIIELDNGYHWGEMMKEELALEPHYKIPYFPDDIQEELWQYTVKDQRGIRVFTPEVAFLVLYLHMEHSKWGVYYRVRFMLDTAYHIKNLPPDWALLAELERKWKLPDARVLPKVFKKVIPDELVPNDPPIDPELLSVLTYLVDNCYLYPINKSEKALNQRNAFSMEWIKHSLLIFRPVKMRMKYNLPEKGAYGRLAWSYVVDVCSKIKNLFTFYVKRKHAEDTPEGTYLKKMREYQDIVDARRGER